MINEIDELMIELAHIKHLLEDKEIMEAYYELELQTHAITSILDGLKQHPAFTN